MSTATSPDFAALRKASRFAALVTLAGTCVVLASIGFSVWRLSDTERKLAAEKKEVDDLKGEVVTLAKTKGELAAATVVLSRTKEGLEARAAELLGEVKKVADQKKALEDQVKGIAATIPPPTKNVPNVKPAAIEQIKDAVAERAELQKQIVVLRTEATFIRDALNEKFANPEKNLGMWNEGKLRGVMTVVLVSPTSKYDERNDPNSPTGKWYDFTLLVKFPENKDLADAMKRNIKSVTYELNHPYRKIAPLISTKSGDNFAVRYDGAGTLRNVVVKIDVEGVGPVVLDYDMTKAHPNAKDK